VNVVEAVPTKFATRRASVKDIVRLGNSLEERVAADPIAKEPRILAKSEKRDVDTRVSAMSSCVIFPEAPCENRDTARNLVGSLLIADWSVHWAG
jgi:hypothetical protein